MDDRRNPLAGGLYDAGIEYDSCGFGLIADIVGPGSRALVDTALEALSRMEHRGGVAADGLSGDGCGVLLYGCETFVRALAKDAGIALRDGRVAAGNVFLPRAEEDAARCRNVLENELQRVGLQVAGWREVPTDDRVCGALARSNMPRIGQVFVVDAGDDADAFERTLYLARRRTEQTLRDVVDFHVVGLSAKLLGYKGMVLPEHLSTLYPDLAHPALSARVVVFHQRFSTNTQPRWPLAQPFRRLAHNGEINSIAGNRAWTQSRASMTCR